MFFFWLYDCPLSLCAFIGCMPYVCSVGFGYRLYEAKLGRCALHKAPERCCGRKINFSPLLPHSLAGGSQWAANSDSAILEMDWETVRAYRGRGITELDCVTRCIYLGHSGVDGHHLIIQQNIHTLFPDLVHTQSFRDFVDPHNMCGSTCLGTLSYPLTLFLYFSRLNYSFHELPLDTPTGVAQCWGYDLSQLALPCYHCGSYRLLNEWLGSPCLLDTISLSTLGRSWLA